MPKERRDRSVSIETSRDSPYRCTTSHHPKRSLIKNPLEKEENLKEWEDARCPVCLEHPHNAILLLCSSHDKGCRPFMCDTSYRHSNCFDQFRKSVSETQSPTSASWAPPAHEAEPEPGPGPTLPGLVPVPVLVPEPGLLPETESKLTCPLCRGQVNGWVVVEPARLFMNTKSRSCASETCEFSGTYTDLRKHARDVHPRVRPSEADPERERDWRRMERQRDLGDLLSTLQSSISEEGQQIDENAPGGLSFEEGGWLTVFFLIRVFRPGNGNGSRSGSNSSSRAQVTVRRRLRTRLWGESYDNESRDDGNESSDGGSGSGSGSGPRNLFQLSRRRPAPDDNNDES